jgi:hypothetical protein
VSTNIKGPTLKLRAKKIGKMKRRVPLKKIWIKLPDSCNKKRAKSLIIEFS